jgi:hypothetical protein
VAQNAAVITVLIMDRPMCRDCIAMKAHLSIAETERYLEIIGQALEIRIDDNARCRACGEQEVVFSLSSLAL